MVRFAYALDLVDDPAAIAEYRHHHERIWPEVAAALRALGLRHLRIYLWGTRLFMHFEAPSGFDPAIGFAAYAKAARVPEWEALMQRFQRQLPGAAPGEWWQQMECIFDLDAQPDAGP